MKNNIIYNYTNIEALFWMTAILLLSLSDPYSTTHYTLFLPTLLFDIPSPGYNLGHSIAHFFHGNFRASLATHPLGIITALFLLGRSFYLLNKSYTNYKLKGNHNG